MAERVSITAAKLTRPACLMALLAISACTTSPYSSQGGGGQIDTSKETGAPGSDRYAISQDRGPDNPNIALSLPQPEVKDEPRSQYGNGPVYRVYGVDYTVMDSAAGYQEQGIASWYGKKFHGHRTSSGETYDMYQLSAAHKTLPLPTWVRVTNLDNGNSTIVRVNDRGPFHHERLIDLSWAAAVKLDITDSGTGRVLVEALSAEPTATNTATSTSALSAGLYLQLGAYQSEQSAQQLVVELRDLSWPAIIAPQTDLYRVWVGPFPADQDRLQARENLESQGYNPVNAVQPTQ